jgi:translation elongation factor EF-G
MKILGGSLRVREQINEEKISQIRFYSGAKYNPAEEAPAGSVCAVTGLDKTYAGQGLGKEEDAKAPVLEPVLTYSVILPDDVDAHTALAKLRLLEIEDPQLNIEWDDLNGCIRICLMGDIQLEILKSIIEERFGFSVGFGQGSIIYKETIADTVEGVGHFEPLRHYAEVHLLLQPAERNSGLSFYSDCPEDKLDKNWQRHDDGIKFILPNG